MLILLFIAAIGVCFVTLKDHSNIVILSGDSMVAEISSSSSFWSYSTSSNSGGGVGGAAAAGAGSSDSMEAITGPMAGVFSCTYANANVNGILHAGREALYFVGSYFWFDKKVLLKWDEIQKVEKMEHGIRVIMGDLHRNSDGDSIHDYTGLPFPDLDRVWLLLISLHNDAIMGRPYHQSSRSPSAVSSTPTGEGGARQPPRRRNSDPLLSSMVRMFDASLIVEEDDQYPSSQSVGGAEDNDEDSLTQQRQQQLSSRYTSPGDSFVFSTAGLDLHEVERLAGKLSLQPIACTHDDVNGKLYVGRAAIYFFGRRWFFWDKKEVLLTWESIRQIQMVDAKITATSTTTLDNATATPNPNNNSNNTVCVGIHIVSKDDGKVFRFLRMDQADKVWASLVSLHNANLTDSLVGLHNRRPSSRRSIRKMNSDPTALLELMSMNDDLAATTQDAEVAAIDSSSRDRSRKGENDDLPEKSPVRVEQPAPSKEAAFAVSADKNRGDDVTDWAELQNNNTIASSTSSRVVVVKEHVLNCSLDKVFQLFLQDNAQFSIAKFLESRGDSNLRESSWQKTVGSNDSTTTTSNLSSQTRIIHYTHPVHAPLAPPTANARKEQTCRRFGDFGLCLWTKTFVDDVPMADCFYVSDRIIFEKRHGNNKKKKGDNNNKDEQVVVSIDFEIIFIKSTMFRGIISKQTSSEVTAVYQALACYMSRALGDYVVAVPVAIAPAKAKPPKGGGSPLWDTARSITSFIMEKLQQSNASVLLLLMIVILQLWVLSELRGVKLALRLMQAGVSTRAEAANGGGGSCPAHLE